MQKICKISGKTFEVTQEDLEFYKKMGVPEPTLCPEERQRRRLVWQNMSKLYHRTCDATGKKVISFFSSDKPYKIYEQNYWWSDKWNALDYGKDFDFSKTFFEQFGESLHNIPMPCLFTEFSKDENSAYTNFSGYNKSCYLIFHADFNEDCYFGTGVKNSKNCVDSLNVFDVEQSYESIDCKGCFNIKYCRDCNNCSDSWFLKDCIGCKNCFGSMNLNNKQYFLFNKQVSKEDYEEFIKNYESGKYNIQKLLSEKFLNFQKTQIHKATYGLNNEKSYGDHIFDCKNVVECFDVKESENMKFCERIYNGPNTNCYDVDQFGARIENIYESANIGVDCKNSIACLYGYNYIDCTYSIFCFNCKNCFGCISLVNKQYCIFNKQYIKEEYFKLKEKIVKHMKKTGEWGEFFPSSISPFGYNETVAQEYYPLDRRDVFQKHLYENGKPIFKWKEDEEKAIYEGVKYEIPNDIKDVGDDILEKILTCECCNKNYRIVGPELQFYRKQNLPIPRCCPNCRHLNRIKLRNPRILFDRKCDKCEKEIKSTYSEDREEIVYCEECYNNEIY